MKTFSLRSALVAMAFVALVLSHALTSARLRNANQELEVVHRNYGHMTIEDATKINVIALAQDESAYRFVVPAGERYFLHLSETTARDNSELPTGKHKTTVALNNCADGEDVILRFGLYINPDKQTPYLTVASQNQGFFTYRPDDWPGGISLSKVSKLEAPEKLELLLNDPIVLMRAKCDSLDRGIVLWLESETHRKYRAEADSIPK